MEGFSYRSLFPHRIRRFPSLSTSNERDFCVPAWHQPCVPWQRRQNASPHPQLTLGTAACRDGWAWLRRAHLRPPQHWGAEGPLKMAPLPSGLPTAAGPFSGEPPRSGAFLGHTVGLWRSRTVGSVPEQRLWNGSSSNVERKCGRKCAPPCQVGLRAAHGSPAVLSPHSNSVIPFCAGQAFCWQLPNNYKSAAIWNMLCGGDCC